MAWTKEQNDAINLEGNNIIVIVVTDQGTVEHKNIEIDVNIDEVKKTVNLINDLIVGTPIDEVSTKLEFEIKPIIGINNGIFNIYADAATNPPNASDPVSPINTLAGYTL